MTFATNTASASPTVLILGGYGAFGRLISAELARLTGANIIIGGRSPAQGEPFAAEIGATFRPVDARDPGALRAALNGCHLLLNAAGPFAAVDLTIPATAIAAGVNYIDIGDGRHYLRAIHALHESACEQGVFACFGASSSPAISAAMVRALCPAGAPIRAIHLGLNAGNRNPVGHSTVASILAYVGQPVPVWQDGVWTGQYGWGMGEFATFPPPIGRRRLQLCDVSELDLLPPLFAARTVTFKAGLELNLFNYGLLGLAQLRRLWPALDLPRLTNSLISASKLFKPFGSLHGSMALWLETEAGTHHALALVAPKDGPRVPTAPAILLAQKLLSGETLPAGAHPCLHFLEFAEIAAYLATFGIFVSRDDGAGWQRS